jgi:hypothetical protein
VGSVYRGGLGGRLLPSNANDGREVPEMSYLIKYSLTWGLARKLVRAALVASAALAIAAASVSSVAAAPARPVAKPSSASASGMFTILDTLGAATSDTTFPEAGSGGMGIHPQSFRGPRFTVTAPTVITEVGAFVGSGRCAPGFSEVPTTLPLVVRIIGSADGLPDPSVVLGTFVLPENQQPGVISYQAVTPNIALEPGTYFALFEVQSADDCAVLLGGSLFPPYEANPLDLGSFEPQTGFVIVERLDIAARIHGVLLQPTSKDECKNGSWQSFRIFKNQGACVAFVVTAGNGG